MTKRNQTQTCHAELVWLLFPKSIDFVKNVRFSAASNGCKTLKRVQGDNYASLVKRLAFTLAEVLITLAIIGVVAALTIPALLSNTNEKGLNTSDSVFQRRLGEALKIMNLQGTLAGQQTTQNFVTELGKHIKIMKTCPKTELSNCFVSEFKFGEETINTTDLTTSKKLNKNVTYTTDTMGVVFGNGIRALIAYNPNASQDQFDNSNTTSPVLLTSLSSTSTTDKKDLVELTTDSMSILYILQERKNNNVYDNSGMLENKGNIRGKRIAFKPKCPKEITHNGKTYCYLATTYDPIDCRSSNSGSDDYEYCKPTPSGATDYWAGAKKACADFGGLPDQSTLSGYFSDGTLQAILGVSGVWFWSSSELDYHFVSRVRSSGGGVVRDLKDVKHSVLCSGN